MLLLYLGFEPILPSQFQDSTL